MNSYTVWVHTISPTLLGSGEGQGSTIDRDIVFDSHGLPFFPARRFKGLMRESCVEVRDMLSKSHPALAGQLPLVESVFGVPGQQETSCVRWGDLHLIDERDLIVWLDWLSSYETLHPLIESQAVVEALTESRAQTRIGTDGVAAPGSLRTSRLLRAGIELSGSVDVVQATPGTAVLLALAALNLRHVGTGRNRGLGAVQVRLLSDAGDDLTQPALDSLKGGAL